MNKKSRDKKNMGFLDGFQTDSLGNMIRIGKPSQELAR